MSRFANSHPLRETQRTLTPALGREGMNMKTEIHKALVDRGMDWVYNRNGVCAGADEADAPCTVRDVARIARESVRNGADEAVIRAWESSAVEIVSSFSKKT